MAHEIETKVLGIDADELKKNIITFGAQEIRNTRLIVDWYRIKGIKNGEDPWFLRIRSDSEGNHEITWKAKSDILGTARKHKEINIKIENPEMHADIFEQIGLEKYAHQEKDRISFVYKDWSFDIDQYPSMPSFLEIEGNSEEHVNEAIKLLNLTQNKTWAKGERILIEEVYGLDWYDMKFLS